ncbi:type II secretion system minor pseudopilin GspK [Paludibacterium paludis]|nr:type II secretion system minor pseudopilin GspK [Paludibacterium paludis]
MAVISVLLIVAVIALLAAALMSRQTTAIRSALAEQSRLEGRWLLRGELGRARTVLYSEAQRTPLVRLDGSWARPIDGAVAGELDGGAARVFSEITDEQAKFNLRNLVQGGRIDPRESAAFLRLCAMLGVPAQQAGLIGRRAITSFADAEPPSSTPEAAEPSKAIDEARRAYGIDDPGARAPAPRLRDIGDLLGTPGIDPASVERLRPYLTVLPRATWINANTAGPEVLAAWVPGLSLEHAKAMLAERDHGQWFINRGDFVNRLRMPQIDESDVRIGITSEWFRVAGALRTPRTTLLMRALLHDDKAGLPSVVWLREGA